MASTFQENHQHTDTYVMDIKEVAEKKLLLKYKPDVIVGGPPCQGFSMAGARIRQNFIDDPRNFLFRHYFEIVQQLRPSYFIIENVKGLLTMDKGAIIDEIIRTF
ncbi:MAG: DNA cytosine methyltransferase, partial [Candidatus Cloacimonas sp.]|nr:DNA cytosine methyltransferase [Candidatus Cloacimonas sp.]